MAADKKTKKQSRALGDDPLQWIKSGPETESVPPEARTTAVNGSPEQPAPVEPEVESATGQAGESEVIVLDPVITINEAGSLHEHLQVKAGAGGDVTIDASQVHMVDMAGLQLLLVFVTRIRAGGGRVHWRNLSPVFNQAAGLLGLGSALGIEVE